MRHWQDRFMQAGHADLLPDTTGLLRIPSLRIGPASLLQHELLPKVEVGSKGEECSAKRNVRSAPDNGHRRRLNVFDSDQRGAQLRKVYLR